MPLSRQEKRLHARHLLLSEIGEEGQARLLEARFRLPADSSEAAARVARTYLERAGLEERELADCVAVPDDAEIERLAGRPELAQAAATLVGAIASVERIKGVLGCGEMDHGAGGIVLGDRAE